MCFGEDMTKNSCGRKIRHTTVTKLQKNVFFCTLFHDLCCFGLFSYGEHLFLLYSCLLVIEQQLAISLHALELKPQLFSMQLPHRS